MKKILYFLVVIFPLLLIIGCQDKPDVYQFPVEKYFYPIPDVPVTENYVIACPFGSVDSGRWFNKSTDAYEVHTGTPVLGGDDILRYYNTKNNPNVLPQQLKWGKQAGVDIFIFSWGGHGWGDTLLTKWSELYAQDNALPRLVIRFDPGYRFGKMQGDSLQKRPDLMAPLLQDFDSLYQYVMSTPFGYRDAQDRVVMVLCNLTNQTNIHNLKDFADTFRNRPVVNGKLWIIGELGSNRTSPERYGYQDATTRGPVLGDTIGALDGFYITDIQNDNVDRQDGFFSFLDFNYNYWQERLRPLGKEYVPTIFPAYDNLVREPSSGNFVIPRYSEEKGHYVVSATANGKDVQYNFRQYNPLNKNENAYKTLANIAKRNVGPHRIIYLNSWNDFRNGNNIEPTLEIGEDYLNYTRQFFKKP